VARKASIRPIAGSGFSLRQKAGLWQDFPRLGSELIGKECRRGISALLCQLRKEADEESDNA